MRPILTALLLGAALGPALQAQEPFSDVDFGVTMTLPAGLRQATVEELARMLRVTPEQAANVSRAEAGGQPVSHSYLWVDDSSPYNRQIAISLVDGQPPFNTPLQLREAQTTSGLDVDLEEIMPPPVNALRLEGTFLREQDDVPMRRIVIYAPDFAGNRFGLITLQAYAGDWPIVKAEFEEAVASLRFMRTSPPTAQAPLGPGTPGRRPGAEGSGDWGSLEVLGSFVLAAVLLGSLMLGGRSG